MKKEQKEEVNELEEVKIELDQVQEQIKDKQARLLGGYSPIIKREYMSIAKELERLNLITEMKKIELSRDNPLRPKFGFENDARWREIAKVFKQEEIDNFEKRIERDFAEELEAES